MPVVPYRIHPFQDRKILYQFLSTCQQKSIEKKYPQIASISLQVNAVDPLAVLQEIVDTKAPHFYLEKPFTGEAIAAVGDALSFTTEGARRFQNTQDFLQNCTDRFIQADDFKTEIPLPQFLLNFTFFDHTSEAESVFPAATALLPRWQITSRQNLSILTTNSTIHPYTNLETLTEELWHGFRNIQQTQSTIFQVPEGLERYFKAWRTVDIGDFKSAVAMALQSIHKNRLNKLVLAHAVDVISQLPLQWIPSLNHLRQLHPDCYIFSVSNGKGKNFIGASPERLISIRNRRLMTDALAGSAPRGKTNTDDMELGQRLLSSQKERHEHQLVVDFLRDRLSEFGLLPQFASVPKLLRLSNIQHLHTPIQATLPLHLHPLELLAELHPTPAVAGIPRNLACQEIRHYEQFERSLYAAPLGWVDSQGNAEFIVGIRSALLEGNRARLYAGAGIVAGSDPDRELAEVKLKLQALLKALV